MTSASPAWAPLLPVAMVGTDRHAGGLPSWPGAIGAAVADLAAVPRDAVGPDRAACDVLRVAAILAAGELAAAPPLPAREAAAPAADDGGPVISDRAFEPVLEWVLREAPARLQQLFLRPLAEARWRLPHAMLPLALDTARRSLELRAAIAPLLGERGVWLAGQRADWHFATGVAAVSDDDPRQWSEGSLEQRRGFLVRERTRDPAAARERFVAALPEMAARERVELARALAVGLGPDDEAVLDRLRADRARDVQAVALELLLRLPRAAHPTRAAARIAALLKHERVLLRKRWVIEPPLAAGADWKADQVDTTPPRGSLGERGGWLHQLVRQVPLAWWTAHLEMSVAELARWADDGEWAEALWTGWRDVLLRAPDPAWADALLEEWPARPGDSLRWRVLGSDDLVFAAAAPAARERYLDRLMNDPATTLREQVRRIVIASPPGGTAPPRLAAMVMARLRPALAAAAASVGPEPDPVGHWLPELACVLPLADVADIEAWPAPADESRGVGAARELAIHIVRARRALQSFLSQTTPTP